MKDISHKNPGKKVSNYAKIDFFLFLLSCLAFASFSFKRFRCCRMYLNASMVAYGSPVAGSLYFAGRPVTTHVVFSGYFTLEFGKYSFGKFLVSVNSMKFRLQNVSLPPPPSPSPISVISPTTSISGMRTDWKRMIGPW